MKKISISLIIIVFSFLSIIAQRNRQPLTGNGKTKTAIYPLKAFDMLEVLWLDGNIEVEFGASSSDISILSDENIFSLLEVTNTEGVLKMEIKGNYGNRLWLEDDKTTIKIRTTSQPRQIIYKSNANALIKGINCGILNIEKSSNGDVVLEGKVSQFYINNDDNGSLKAEKLIVQQASVEVYGNGYVSVNAQQIVKKVVKGNGGLRNSAENATLKSNIKSKRINITFFNPTLSRKEYYVEGVNERGKKFSYGLELDPKSKQEEYLPIGTRIYYKGEIIAILKESDDKQIIKL